MPTILSNDDSVATLDNTFEITIKSVQDVKGETIAIDGSSKTFTMPEGATLTTFNVNVLQNRYAIGYKPNAYGNTANPYYLSLKELIQYRCGTSYLSRVDDNSEIEGVSFTCGEENQNSGTLVGVTSTNTLVANVGTWEISKIENSDVEVILWNINENYRENQDNPLFTLHQNVVWKGWYDKEGTSFQLKGYNDIVKQAFNEFIKAEKSSSSAFKNAIVGSTQYIYNELGTVGQYTFNANDNNYIGFISLPNATGFNVSGTYAVEGDVLTLHRVVPSETTLTYTLIGESAGGTLLSFNGASQTIAFDTQEERDTYVTSVKENFSLSDVQNQTFYTLTINDVSASKGKVDFFETTRTFYFYNDATNSYDVKDTVAYGLNGVNIHIASPIQGQEFNLDKVPNKVGINGLSALFMADMILDDGTYFATRYFFSSQSKADDYNIGNFTSSAITPTSGTVIDDYVKGATVCVDVNNDGKRDSGDTPCTLTNATGQFRFSTDVSAFPLVMSGGTDVGTGNPFTGTYTATGGSTVLTPLTTILQAIIKTGKSFAEAHAIVKTRLGLPDIDLSTYDPITALASGTAAEIGAAKHVFAQQSSIQIILTTVAATIAATVTSSNEDDLTNGVAAQISALMNVATPVVIDIADASNVTSIINATAVAASTTVDAILVAALAAQVNATSNQVISNITTSTGTIGDIRQAAAQVAEVTQNNTATIAAALAAGTNPADIADTINAATANLATNIDDDAAANVTAAASLTTVTSEDSAPTTTVTGAEGGN